MVVFYKSDFQVSTGNYGENIRIQYFTDNISINEGLKGTVVDLTHTFVNWGPLEITTTTPLKWENKIKVI